MKIPGLLFIIALYCYAIGITHSNTINSISFGRQLTTESNNHYFSTATDHLLSHTLNSESWSNPYSNTTPTALKISFTGYSLIEKETEHLQFNTISQFFYHSKSFLIRFRKTDIIFPFHYFL